MKKTKNRKWMIVVGLVVAAIDGEATTNEYELGITASTLSARLAAIPGKAEQSDMVALSNDVTQAQNSIDALNWAMSAVQASTSTWNSVESKAELTSVVVLDNALSFALGDVAKSGLRVSGAGTPNVNADYTFAGTTNSHVWTNSFAKVHYNATQWEISSVAGTEWFYRNVDDAAYPPPTGWETMSHGTAPMPSISLMPEPTANHAATLATGITETWTFMRPNAVTAQVWFAGGIMTNVDLDISD